METLLHLAPFTFLTFKTVRIRQCDIFVSINKYDIENS